MKKTLLIILVLLDSLVFSQFHKTYDWSNENSEEIKVDSTYKGSSFGLINKYIVEYQSDIDSLSNSFDKFLTRHTKIKIVDIKGVDYHKTLYIPMYNSLSLIDLKVKITDSLGNVVNLERSDLIEQENDKLNKNFKVYKLNNLEINSSLEYIYTTKEKNEIHGSQILQEEYFNNKTEFILIPGKFRSKLKAYNTNEVFNTKLINGVKAKNFIINNMNSISNEEYSTLQANRVNVIYQCYSADKKNSQNEFWTNITNSVHPIAFPSKYTKELITLNDLILPNKANYTTFQKLNIIDNYLKKAFIIEENGKSELSNLDYILKNKKASNIGIIQLYSSLFTYNDINYELLITSNRYFNKFDPEFFNPDNLRELLFYIPEEKKYIIPDRNEYRIGEAPFNVLGNYGIFINKNKDYYFSTIIENDKNYSVIKRTIEVDFKKMKSVIISEVQEFTGHWATTNRALVNLTDANSDLTDYLTTSGIASKKVIDYSIKNKELNQSEYNKPFVVNSTISTESLINEHKTDYPAKKRLKKYNFKLGSIIGTQSQLYSDNERVNPIEIRYPNFYEYSINIKIPRGYKVEDANRININKKYVSNGNITAKFHSTYTINKNLLTITIEEFYKSLKYSKAKYQDFREVINAAADFNKLEITFIKN
jgi:hypothetical protein|tara:strand:+ start:10366 stop:12315 length:1950 start_codon:yes stop_codon:yes gene_type:complete